jgi:O-antigen/teichoic acid export membrane protein
MFTNLLQSLISRLSVAIIGFLVLVISAKYLGVSTRGEISLFLFNVALLQIITEVFTGYHLVHFMTKYHASKIYGFGIVFILCMTLMGNSILWFAGKHIEGFFWQAFLITALVTLNTFQCVMILGFGKLKLYYGLSLLQPALLLCFLLSQVLFTTELTLKAYIYPLLFSFVLSSVISFGMLWFQLKSKTDNKPFASLPILKNGLAAQLALMMFVLGNKYSFYLLEPGAALGLYAAAISITESVLIVVSAMLPMYLSKIASEQSRENTGKLTLKLGVSVVLFCSFGLIILNLLPETLYLKLLGDGFKGIKTVVLFYSPAVIFTALYLILSNYFSGRGEARLVLRNNLVGFVILLIITPLLVGRFQLKGAALSSVCVCALNSTLLGYKFYKITAHKSKES